MTVLYLEDYGMTLAALLCAGVDVWLNTPIAPNEASGTSGMKAAVNGVPSLSVLDGWWLEGHVEGVTGWAIGSDRGIPADPTLDDPARDTADATEIYRVLGDVIVPLYYSNPDGFAEVGRGAMAFNGSFFNTQRMVGEYASSAYRRVRRRDRHLRLLKTHVGPTQPGPVCGARPRVIHSSRSPVIQVIEEGEDVRWQASRHGAAVWSRCTREQSSDRRACSTISAVMGEPPRHIRAVMGSRSTAGQRTRPSPPAGPA